MRKFLFLFVLLGVFILVNAQQPVLIPAFTGYATPTEKYDANLFDTKNGLQNWTDLNQSIQYSFFVRNTGSLQVSMNTKNEIAGSMVAISIAGKTFQISIKKSTAFTNQSICKLNITDTGFYTITIKGIKKAGKKNCRYSVFRIEGSGFNRFTHKYQRKTQCSICSFALPY